MSELESIAKQKADTALDRRLVELAAEIKRIQAELSAKGLLRSGAMLKRVGAACAASLESQATTVVEEYKWVLTQALVAGDSYVQRLASDGSRSLEAFRIPVRNHLEHACHIAGQPKLFDRLYKEFEAKEVTAKSNVALSLRSQLVEKRRGVIRGLPSLIPKLISKLFGGTP